jgi:RNA polymerase-binding transcription factor DksA
MPRKRRDPRPGGGRSDRIQADAQRTRERLATLDRQAALRERALETGDNTPRADVLEAVQDAMAKTETLATREILVSRLKALSRAQEKAQEGTYGLCDICGEAIPQKRLRAVPAAAHCLGCAELLERETGAAPAGVRRAIPRRPPRS